MGCQNLKMRLASVRKRYVILALGIITITIWLSRCHIDSKLDGDQRLYLMNGFKPALTDDENIYIEHFQTVYDYYQQRKVCRYQILLNNHILLIISTYNVVSGNMM